MGKKRNRAFFASVVMALVLLLTGCQAASPSPGELRLTILHINDVQGSLTHSG